MEFGEYFSLVVFFVGGLILAHIVSSFLKQKRSFRKYSKYEFCKSVNCNQLIPESKTYGINECCMFKNDHDCIFTAKEFHRWLKDNGFEIMKKEDKAITNSLPFCEYGDKYFKTEMEDIK